jgi:hypothetical protein
MGQGQLQSDQFEPAPQKMKGKVGRLLRKECAQVSGGLGGCSSRKRPGGTHWN